MSSAPILLRLAPHRQRLRVLELEPVRPTARTKIIRCFLRLARETARQKRSSRREVLVPRRPPASAARYRVDQYYQEKISTSPAIELTAPALKTAETRRGGSTSARKSRSIEWHPKRQ